MSATRDRDDTEDKKPKAKAQRYVVQPKDMSTGEMHTMRDLVIEFGVRVVLKIHEYKKHQVWEIYADEDSLAKYVEFRLSRQRDGHACLRACYDAPMTEPGDDGLPSTEAYLLTPLKWDQKTGREADKKR